MRETRIILSLLLLALVRPVFSQNQSHNYVWRVTYLDETSTDSIVQVQYYDDLGRPNQLVTGGVNANGTYLHTHTEYDGVGRECKTWLPVIGSQTPGYISNISASSPSQYQDSRAYSETDYDALDRTTFISTPGESWVGHSKRTNYRLNNSNEVKSYTATNLTNWSYYPQGVLTCVETLDEDGIRQQTFTDQLGRTVLERRGDTGDTSDTYYVYNDLSQLVYVLTPEYQQSTNTSTGAYCYEYDQRGRMSSRKLPGCEAVTMEHDNADRLIRMQDGLLRASSEYRVYTYDIVSRLVSQSIEGGVTELINYYDNYDFLSQYTSLTHEDSAGPVFGLQGYSDNETYAIGNLTGVWQRASDGTELLTTYVYDDHGRIVKQAESGLDGKVLVTKYTYNFVGDVTSETSVHYHYVQATGRLVSDYELSRQTAYNHRGTRLASSTTVSLTDNSGSAIAGDIVSVPSYDSYGRVTSLDRSGTSGDVSYTYDLVHGWLTGIEYPSSGFSQTLYRETGGNTSCWNGSISAMTWQTESGILRRYDYSYDNQNRLTEASYSHYGSGQGTSSSTLTLIPASSSVPNYGTNYSYDRNSNLKWVKRYGRKNDGTYDVIDKLRITHTGNQLTSVYDSIRSSLSYTGNSEFVDGSNTGSEYSYNGNGALTKDLNRGITSIEYDKLGHPTQVTFNGGNTISYVYSADGRKLRTTHRQGTHQPVITDYAGPYEFKGGTISRVAFSGGYYSYNATASQNNWTAHYYIQDYLGSNREVVNRNATSTTTAEQVTHYYPYGGVIGDISTGENLQKNKFEGKELDRSFGLDNYYIHARNYYAMLPMWDRVDPLAEKYYGISPYAYCAGDPVNIVDPTGCAPDSLEAAVMCQHLYRDTETLIGGWQQNSVKELKSGLSYGIYSRTKEDGNVEYAVVFCGTKGLTDINGWKANFDQAKGNQTDQYDQAQTFASEFINNVQRETTFIGHSKGGGQAALAAATTGCAGITFNAAGLSSIYSKGLNFSSVDAYIVQDELLNRLQMSRGITANGNKRFIGPPLYYNSLSSYYSIYKRHSISSVIEALNYKPLKW